MVLICNGLYKSGSTWVYLISNAVLQYPMLDNSTLLINETQLHSLINILDKVPESCKKIGEHGAVFKLHCYDIQLLKRLKLHGAMLLFSDRSTKDILISHHYHFQNEKFNLQFIFYLLSVGFIKALEVDYFRFVVQQYGFSDYYVHYEDLKAHPVSAIEGIAEVAGRMLNNRSAEEVVQLTRLTGCSDHTLITGMKDRSWFFSRGGYQAAGIFGRILLVAVAATSSALVKNRISRLIVKQMLFLLPGRRCCGAR